MINGNKREHILELLRYGFSFRAITGLFEKYAWYIHDHVAPMSQMKKADASGAVVSVVIGDDDIQPQFVGILYRPYCLDPTVCGQ